MKKTLKIAIIVIAGLMVLLTVILFAVSGGIFNNLIADKVTQTVNHQMDGELNIENIEGNIFSHFTVNKLSLKQKGKNLVLLDNLEVKYNIWAVTDKKINVDLIHIKGLFVNLKQENDSLWNLQKFFPQSDVVENDSVVDDFSWLIDLKKVEINNFTASVESKDSLSMIPRLLKLNSSFSFAMSGNSMNFNLDKFELSTKNPSLEVNNLKFKAGIVDSVFTWTNLNLKLKNTNIQSQGSVPLNNMGNSEITIKALPVDFDDFNDWLPMLHGNPHIELLVNNKSNISNISFKLTQKEQSITIFGQLTDLMSNPAYLFTIKVDSINGEYWTHNPELKSNIKGKVDIKGSGFDLKNNSLKIKADFPDLKYSDYKVSNFILSLEKDKDNLDGTVGAHTVYGNMDSKAHINKIFTIPEYAFYGTLRNIDIAKITESDALKSNINLIIRGKGTGTDLKTLIAEIEMQFDSSTIFEMPVNDFSSALNLNGCNYILNGFNIETPFALIRASGYGNLKKLNYINLSIDSKDIQKLTSALNQKDLDFAGQMKTYVTGSLDSLNFLSDLNIEKLRLDSIKVGQIKGSSDMLLSKKGNSGWADIQLNDARFQNLDVKMIRLKSELNKETVTNDFTFQYSDSLKGKVLSNLHLGKIPVLYLPEINVNAYNNIWTGGSEDSFISFGKDSIEINKLSVTSGESAFTANGIFAFHGIESLNVEIKNFNLLHLSGLSLLPYRFSGNLNASLDIAGTGEKPLINGSLNIDKPEMDSLRFSSFNASVNYADDFFKFTGNLNKNEMPLVFADIKVPAHFSFSDSVFILRNSELLQSNINIDKLALSEFTPYIPMQGLDAKGLMNFNMKISNSVNSPEVKGNFNLFKGSVSYKKLGIEYNKIEMRSQLNNNLFSLDSLMLYSGKGHMKMYGSVELDSLLNGEIKKIDLNLSGKNFRAFNSEMLKAVIDANLSVKGDAENSVFNGDLSVLSSALNVDLLSKEYDGVSEDIEQPLLIKAQEEYLVQARKQKRAQQEQTSEEIRKQRQKQTIEKTSKQNMKEAQESASEEIRKQANPIPNVNEDYNREFRDTVSKLPPDIYKNLTGQFEIEIPRNSWVKGKSMNFELSGKVKAIKEGDQINFYGDLNIKRGYYKIYGRKLEVEEGKITLTGGQITNPIVDFTIAYKFRDPDNLLRTLSLNVSGRVSKPKIEFYLDDESIDEKEAISYLLFNKSPDQLDTQETASASDSNADILKDMAIGQLSNAVKDVLQSSLGLDVFEFSGEGGGTKGSVSIGKYITNNLYLNYERSFSLDKKDKIIEPEKISMEYQIYRSLFLQATNQGTNSGFDFILKWNWK